MTILQDISIANCAKILCTVKRLPSIFVTLTSSSDPIQIGFVKLDVRNAHNEVWRSAVIKALEAEPTLQHLAWFAAVIVAPTTALG